MQKFTIAALVATLTSAVNLQQSLSVTDADQVWTTGTGDANTSADD